MHAVSLYADDLLIYIKNPATDTYNIAHMLSNFHKASGLRVNWQKSCMYPLLPLTPEFPILVSGTPLLWQAHTFRYLGINIYHASQDLLDSKLTRAVAALRKQVKFWLTLPLSVVGRIALSKMVMLPRLLYYLTNLPLILPASFFRTLHTLLTQLVWDTGRRRLALKKL